MTDLGSHPHLSIIEEYLAGRLSVEVAARQILNTKAPPLNIEIGPKLRPLFAELYRIRTGQDPPSIPPYVADANRFQSAASDFLGNALASTRAQISKPPLSNLDLRLYCFVDAKTHAVAEQLASWFIAQGDCRVVIENPTETKSDDWNVVVSSSARRWDLPSLERWEAMLRRAPLGSDAKYSGLNIGLA